MDAQTIVALCAGAVVFLSVVLHVRVVPARRALVVERLGKYRRTLEAGFHVLLPYVDRVRYRHSLKEQAIDVPPQPCFTQDNVKITVDGVLYFRVIDPRRASYGILNYEYATIQLAQTTMRSVIGKLELDRTFEERDQINGAVVQVLDEASDPWGVKVTRYEIQNIQLPPTVQESMEYQIKADRQKRAVIARSVGEMEARINHSIGVMEEAINRSEGEKARQINEAEGRAQEILAIAAATAAGPLQDRRSDPDRGRPGGPGAAHRRGVHRRSGEARRQGPGSGAARRPYRHQVDHPDGQEGPRPRLNLKS